MQVVILITLYTVGERRRCRSVRRHRNRKRNGSGGSRDGKNETWIESRWVKAPGHSAGAEWQLDCDEWTRAQRRRRRRLPHVNWFYTAVPLTPTRPSELRPLDHPSWGTNQVRRQLCPCTLLTE